jgi:hemerythrin-like metal-binding protein
MELLEWKDAYSVGIPEFDQEHLHIVLILNKLFQAISKKRLAAAVGPLIEELVSYTQKHFHHEEEEMERLGYPDRERHAAEHHALEQKVLEFQAQYRAGKLEKPQTLIPFLKSWLTGHIMGSDSRYAASIREHPP